MVDYQAQAEGGLRMDGRSSRMTGIEAKRDLLIFVGADFREVLNAFSRKKLDSGS